MFFFIGLAVVFGSVLGGYLPHGSPLILFQPLEFLIILGAATGAFIIANPKDILSLALKRFSRVMKGAPYSKADFLELLTLQYAIYKLIKSKGTLAIESHLDNPHESSLFSQFPKFIKDHHVTDFVCDYLRLMTMGTDDKNTIEDLMNAELEVHHQAEHAAFGAWGAMGDGMPAFGIVAAVLGVIVTMGSITEPPEVLGHLVGGALVGTFFGILMAYGVFAPVAKNLENFAAAEAKYYDCIKSGMLAHLEGFAPAISVEFARKVIPDKCRPSFTEVEEACGNLPPMG